MGANTDREKAVSKLLRDRFSLTEWEADGLAEEIVEILLATPTDEAEHEHSRQ